LNLFDQYVHGTISRRAFLDGAQNFAVGGVTASALFEMLRPNYAWAVQVPEQDSRIAAESATVPSPRGNGSINGYLVRPSSATAKLPVVLVIHENRGLNPYIRDVARRLAVAGFVAFAPDGLTSVGGYPNDDEKGVQLFQGLDRAKLTEDFLAAAIWLKSRPESTGKLGAVGFCFGGGVVNQLAVRMGTDLAAAVPFYGSQPSAEELPKSKRLCWLTMASLTRALPPDGPPLMPLSRPRMCNTKATSIPAPTTVSITTRRPDTMRRRQNWRGSEHSIG
jgi:carboxymethylenebutenolidase